MFYSPRWHADEGQLEELAEDWAAHRISRAEWLRARDAIAVRLDERTGRVG